MTKDVLVSISGNHIDRMDGAVQMEKDGDEAIEVVTPAQYYLRNGKHYIIYDEVVEGMAGTIHNKIKITGTDMIEIVRSGLSSSHMVFEKNKKSLTYYHTPFGQMLVGVNTKEMQIQIAENRIDVQVGYELDINHESMADCMIRMNIISKEMLSIQ